MRLASTFSSVRWLSFNACSHMLWSSVAGAIFSCKFAQSLGEVRPCKFSKLIQRFYLFKNSPIPVSKRSFGAPNSCHRNASGRWENLAIKMQMWTNKGSEWVIDWAVGSSDITTETQFYDGAHIWGMQLWKQAKSVLVKKLTDVISHRVWNNYNAQVGTRERERWQNSVS